jgi:tetrapyrrole methylase family protein / MazG family protein
MNNIADNLPGITILGLGPGDPQLLTRHAWRLLENATEIYLRTRHHPVVPGLPNTLKIMTFDDLYENSASFEEVYDRIVEEILELGRRPQGVYYAVPGHPFVAEATSHAIFQRARQEGLPVRVVEGISFLGSTISALQIDPLPHVAFVDALELVSVHVPPFPPDAPALIAQIHSRAVASNVKLTLLEVYPDEHPVRLVHGAGTQDVFVEDLQLHEIDRDEHIGLLTTLYLPPLGPATSFEAFQEVIAHLRAPDGCPWDREQDHQTLRPHLLEEAYEVLTALDADDPQALVEELGDLLLQIVLHAQIASDLGEFKMVDVLRGIHTKIVSRHPHVFGELKLDNAQSVVENWERIKANERKTNKKAAASLLEGVSLALPALVQAQTYQLRAARVGFDWPQLEEVLLKVQEEIAEFRAAQGEAEQASEIGDLLFALVNLARWLEVDAESALREANARFRKRFAHIEEAARKQDRPLSDLSLEEMEQYWQEAKRIGQDQAD